MAGGTDGVAMEVDGVGHGVDMVAGDVHGVADGAVHGVAGAADLDSDSDRLDGERSDLIIFYCS